MSSIFISRSVLNIVHLMLGVAPKVRDVLIVFILIHQQFHTVKWYFKLPCYLLSLFILFFSYLLHAQSQHMNEMSRHSSPFFHSDGGGNSHRRLMII